MTRTHFLRSLKNRKLHCSIAILPAATFILMSVWKFTNSHCRTKCPSNLQFCTTLLPLKRSPRYLIVHLSPESSFNSQLTILSRLGFRKSSPPGTRICNTVSANPCCEHCLNLVIANRHPSEFAPKKNTFSKSISFAVLTLSPPHHLE